MARQGNGMGAARAWHAMCESALSLNVSMVVVMLKVVIRVLTLCGNCMTQYFGRTYCFHLPGD